MRLWVTLDEETSKALKELAERNGSAVSRTASELLTVSLRGEQGGGSALREILEKGVSKFEPDRKYIVSEVYELGGKRWSDLQRGEKMIVAKSLARLAREASSPITLSGVHNSVNYYALKGAPQ